MDFYKRMEIVCNYIPHGTVATYGQIALLCGKPRNARQVGFALSHRMNGKEIPAYRLVNRLGYLAGAMAFDTPDQQRQMLEAEKIKVSRDGFVDLAKFGWKNTLEDAEYLMGEFKRKGI